MAFNYRNISKVKFTNLGNKLIISSLNAQKKPTIFPHFYFISRFKLETLKYRQLPTHFRAIGQTHFKLFI